MNLCVRGDGTKCVLFWQAIYDLLVELKKCRRTASPHLKIKI